MQLRRIARLSAWALACVGVAVVVAAWRCRSEVRVVWVRIPSHIGYVQLTPRHVDAALWNRYDFDAFQHRKPLFTVGRVAFLTTTEPVGNERASITEKLADAGRAWHAGGFGLVHGNRFPPATPSLREAWVPTWFVVGAAFAPLALGTLRRRRKRAAAAAGPTADTGTRRSTQSNLR
jgi:hypothetical protein